MESSQHKRRWKESLLHVNLELFNNNSSLHLQKRRGLTQGRGYRRNVDAFPKNMEIITSSSNSGHTSKQGRKWKFAHLGTQEQNRIFERFYANEGMNKISCRLGLTELHGTNGFNWATSEGRLGLSVFPFARSDDAVGKVFAANCKVAGLSPLPGSNSKAQYRNGKQAGAGRLALGKDGWNYVPRKIEKEK